MLFLVPVLKNTEHKKGKTEIILAEVFIMAEIDKSPVTLNRGLASLM